MENIKGQSLLRISVIIENLFSLVNKLDKSSCYEESDEYLDAIADNAMIMSAVSETLQWSSLSSTSEALAGKALESQKETAEPFKQCIDALRQLVDSINQEFTSTSREESSREPLWKTYKNILAPNDTHSKKIIIVDQNNEFIRYMKVHLAQQGFSSIAISDGNQLSSKLQAHQACAVIINICTSNDATFNIIRNLRCQHQLNCPVIFTAENDDYKTRLAAIDVGGVGFFLKPIAINSLIATLSELTKSVSEIQYRAVVVDDNPNQLNNYSSQLKQSGIFAKTIVNPVNAISTIKALSPDVIIIVINESLKSAHNVTQVIRQHENFSHLPIIYLTEESHPTPSIIPIQPESDRILNKSDDSSELIDHVIERASRTRHLQSTLSRR